jgi:glycosyltransferase involved in cell wall biosynthesis
LSHHFHNWLPAGWGLPTLSREVEPVNRKLEIAILVSTYQRPSHLRRALLSIGLQRNVAGRMEVVVTDDGSIDETPNVVREFAESVDFPVHFTTHPHTTFQLARSRNEGVRASTAPYLLFLDGDCLLPPDHVATHLQRRRSGTVMAGNCARLNEATTAQIDDEAVRRGDYIKWTPAAELRRLRRLDRKARLYLWLRHPTKPKMIGNNVGIWRSDYIRVNGYDENFEGWGCEDDDLRLRLRRTGVRIQSILRWTHTYHLWHQIDITCPTTWRQGRNVTYLNRHGVLVRCRHGLVQRRLQDIRWRIVGIPPARFARLLPPAVLSPNITPEVEIVFSPSGKSFSHQAACHLLVALDDTPQARRLAKSADVVVADCELPAQHAYRVFRLHQLDEALRSVA